jgi:iron complex transport system ATP-binding protein
MKVLLEIRDLATGFEGPKGVNLCLHESVNFKVTEGQFVTILGPNGAGKSTFIKTLLGFHKALSGDVFYEDELLKNMNVRELAKKVAVVLTDRVYESFLTVYDIVSTGRYPYAGFSGRLTTEDHAYILDALKLVGMHDFSQRNFLQLSDGEKQKVMLARAVAQQTPIIILDEPVAFIDAPGKVEIMELLKHLSKDLGKAIIAATHDLSMAIRYADQIWLLGGDGQLAEGKPDELLEMGMLNEIFDRKDIKLNSENMLFEKKS